MNLPQHILIRIIAAAALCLLANAAYVLQQSDQQTRQNSQRIADSVGKQLSFQHLQLSAGFAQSSSFPDFSLWKQTHHTSGICLDFIPANGGHPRSLCNGSPSTTKPPEPFSQFYTWLFQPGLPIRQTLTSEGQNLGTLSVTPSAELQIAQAWTEIVSLLGLSISTVAGVCCLVYLGIRRALQPIKTIIAGLQQLQQGELSYRLPSFALDEWRGIASAINQLATSQQQLLEERQRLALQLLNLQEEERRYLARELHDEFGQCLAASNALVAAISQTAQQQCPALLAEATQISHINQHILTAMRSLLQRLRPAELDGLGLAASLHSLVASWNAHSHGKTAYRLSFHGDSSKLPETLATTLFRISQEALTNIAKHAAAQHAHIILTMNHDHVSLQIEDDGQSQHLPFTTTTGIGLLGIRERVQALAGNFTLNIRQPHGLCLKVCLPLPEAEHPK
ncbi:histidine kinase [Methylosoma difficile]